MDIMALMILCSCCMNFHNSSQHYVTVLLLFIGCDTRNCYVQYHILCTCTVQKIKACFFYLFISSFNTTYPIQGCRTFTETGDFESRGHD
jgi:hypothetical protein